MIRASSSRARCGRHPVAVAGGGQDLRRDTGRARPCTARSRAVVVAGRERGGRGSRRRASTASASTAVGSTASVVAAVATDDDGRVAERAAQPGDLRLQRVAAGVGGALAPEVVDQPVGAHEVPGLEREAHEQLRGLAARNRDELAVASDLDRAEHRDLQHVESVRAADAGETHVSARCQRSVSALPDDAPMSPTDPEQLVHQLVVGRRRRDRRDRRGVACERRSDDPRRRGALRARR